MSKSINPVEKFFIRYNLVILITAASAVLGASIYLSYGVLASSSDPNNAEVQKGISSSFDQKTREKIDSLHVSSDPDIPTTPPPGRINPFEE